MISDIHGNLPALEAVLADAEEQGVGGYFFLGDYFEDFPYPNEVTEVIRSLDNAWVVRGNKEDYLCDLAKQDPSIWTHEQYAALYWNYRNLREENRAWLMELPESLTVPLEGGGTAFLTHSSKSVFGVQESGMMRPSVFARAWEEGGFSKERFYTGLKRELLSQISGREEPGALPWDVYLFGHTHLQWHLELEGGLFLNPGSCGLPLDGNTDAPYTLLIRGDSGWKAVEHRVPYDFDGLICAVKASDIYRDARIWCDLMTLELESARDQIVFFFEHAEALATERGENLRPMPNATFRKAFAQWYPSAKEKKLRRAIE